MISGRFNAGIRPAHRLSPGMVAARISDTMPVAVVGSPSYLAANGKPQTPRDLLAHDCIRFRLQNGVLFPWTFRIKGRTVEVQVEGRLIATGRPMDRGAALAGAGILQTPLPYVAADLAAGRLVSVLEGWPPPTIDGFYLYYPKSRQMRPRSRRSWNSCAHRMLDPRRAVQGGLRKAGLARSTGSLTADRKLDRRAIIDELISPRLAAQMERRSCRSHSSTSHFQVTPPARGRSSVRPLRPRPRSWHSRSESTLS
jgi:hypothetical protein